MSLVAIHHAAEVAFEATDDVDTARAEAASSLAFYETVPSYQRVIAREGVSKAGDLAVIGNAESVTRQLKEYRDAGGDGRGAGSVAQ